MFNNVHNYHGVGLMVGIAAFGIQIFCDFSGYSDIAIGAARVMGFRLMINFRRPYASRSIAEFWSRWHISLSTWFRDYLYIPLGGNRVTVPRWYFNLFIVFLVSGLWHGANWTFIVWGALHGFYLVFGLITKPLREKLSKLTGLTKVPTLNAVLNISCTLALVFFAWIFFRANTLSDAIYVVKNIFVPSSGQPLLAPLYVWGLTFYYKAPFIILFLFMEAIHYYQGNYGSVTKKLDQQKIFVRWAAYLAFVFIIILFGTYDNAQFIYFQF